MAPLPQTGWTAVEKKDRSVRVPGGLMLNALAAVIECGDVADPIKILKEAHSRTAKPGSSTACGLHNYPGAEGRGFEVRKRGVRRNAVAYELSIQQSRFNCPFQFVPSV
ncbi:unnamed protein product [Linum trigynum]|uniref:Uncharacterized protein n=1 Tax=Linum trigynum TaxID=586398 RepID=A0AAV2EKJ1_9ROSI